VAGRVERTGDNGSGRGRAVLHQLLENSHVDVDGRRVKGEVRAVQPKAIRIGDGQCLSEGEEGLAEVGAGLFVAHVAPEQGGELIARVGAAPRERQVGQEPLSFPGRHPDGRTGFQACLEASEDEPAMYRTKGEGRGQRLCCRGAA
jgi:hypothetical protein